MTSHHPQDHRDMLEHQEAPKGQEAIVVKKPDWIVHDGAASAPATPIDGAKKGRMGDLLKHTAHTPSNGSFTPGPAPYKEDGASVWERDGTAKKKKKLCFPNGHPDDGHDEKEDDEEVEEEEEVKENDPRWNIKRRSPVKRQEGEFEKDFRSRKSYSGKKADEGEKEEEEKEEEKKEQPTKEGTEEKREEAKEKEEAPKKEETQENERKVKIPKHLVSGPLW